MPSSSTSSGTRSPAPCPITCTASRLPASADRRKRRSGEGIDNLAHAHLPYICPSLYASQLDHYLRLFPQERISVVDQADLLSDRRETLREIFAFLSVQENFDSPELDTELNASRDRRVYQPGYVPLAERLARIAFASAPRKFRRSPARLCRANPLASLENCPSSMTIRARLEDLYTGEVQRLRALTGKAFPTWSV